MRSGRRPWTGWTTTTPHRSCGWPANRSPVRAGGCVSGRCGADAARRAGTWPTPPYPHPSPPAGRSRGSARHGSWSRSSFTRRPAPAWWPHSRPGRRTPRRSATTCRPHSRPPWPHSWPGSCGSWAAAPRSPSSRCPRWPAPATGVAGELASRGPAGLGRLGAARSARGPPSAYLGLGPSGPGAVRQPARPPAAHGRTTCTRAAGDGCGHRPVPPQPGHTAGLGGRPGAAAGDRPALVETRPRLPGRHRGGGRRRRRSGRSTGPALLGLCRLAAPDRRRPRRLPRTRGVPVAPAPPGHPGRAAGGRAESGRPAAGSRPGRGQAHPAGGPAAHGVGRPTGRPGARRPLRPGRPRREDRRGSRLEPQARLSCRPPDHAGPVAADRRRLRHRPDHRHRTRSLPGRKGRPQVLPHRRQGHRPRLRRACPGRLSVGQPLRPVRPVARTADGRWRGNPAAIHNRLMAMLGWTEPYYKDVASLLLRLALNAPGEDGPVRSSQQLMARMDPELLVRLYEHDPDRRREAESLVGHDQARAVKGAVGRFANFFAATAGSFDAGQAGWSFEDVEFAYLRAPYLAGREDADACVRLLLEDFAHYATLRKPRKGEDATLVFDEFSAIAGGREAAIQLVERVRDAGCALYLSAQSADGLGDEAQQRRLVGACSGGLLIHAMPDPDTLLRAAGVVKVVEQTWRLDSQGPTGNSSARISERPRIEPGQVQQAREGEAWYIARGRFQHLMVARPTISEGYRARAHALVALARSWRPQEVLPGARSWVEAQAAGQEALRGLQGHLAIEPPPTSFAADLPPESAGPAPAGYRLRLAVAAA